MSPKKDITTYIPKELILLFSIIVAIVTISLFMKIAQTGISIDMSYSFIPVILGVVFEQKILGYTWKEILIKTFIAYCIFIGFVLIYVNKENMNFDRIFTTFLFIVLILSYMVISIGYSYYIKKSKKLVAKLSEGILLLQSISLIYLIFNSGFSII